MIKKQRPVTGHVVPEGYTYTVDVLILNLTSS